MAMTERDRKVLMVVIALVVLGACWFLLIKPKREAVSAAETARNSAQSALETAKQAEVAAKSIKLAKPQQYAKLIKLGAAVPVDDDFASLLVQISDLADDSNVQFRNLAVGAAAGGAGPTGAVGGTSCDQGATGGGATAPAAATTPTSSTGGSGSTGSTAQTWVGRDKEKAEQAAAAANARNAAAMAASCAAAPTLTDLSAKAAGLTTYNYSLTFKGSFFNLDTMLGSLLGLVKTHNGRVTVNGRLLDISSMTYTVESFPILNANVQLTGYSAAAGAATTDGGSPAAGAGTPAGTPAATTTPEN